MIASPRVGRYLGMRKEEADYTRGGVADEPGAERESLAIKVAHCKRDESRGILYPIPRLGKER